MPRAASTVVEALSRYPRSRREDQLTELFALVLQTVPELSNWFVGQAVASGREPQLLPRGDRSLGVFTQASAPASGRPDMIIDYFDRNGRPRRILSEHKIDADFTDIQHTAYERWKSPDALVLVAPVARRPPAGFDRHITWASIAREVERILRTDPDLAGPHWRGRALKPRVPSRVRLLFELLTMLERQNVGVDRSTPVDLTDVLIFQGAAQALDHIAAFLAMVRDQDVLAALKPSDISQDGRTTWWFTLDTLEARWPVAEDTLLIVLC